MSVPQLRFKDEDEDEDEQDFPRWQVKKLSDVNIYISDGNYGEQYPKAEELKQSGVPFIRANNIKGLSLTWEDMRFIDHAHHKILTSGHLETDDILVTTRGDIGMVAYVESEFHGSNINAQICLIRIIDSKKLSSRFLLQLLSSAYCQKQFKELQTGSALKQLPKKNLAQIEILYPVIPEQTKIANFLTAVDEKISQLTQKYELLTQYKKGVMQQIFSQALRFKPALSEVEGDEDGREFAEWEAKSLKDIAQIVGGGTPETGVKEYWNGNIQWFTPTELKSKYAAQSQRTITESGFKNSSAKLLPIGTLLFSSRATVG
ncbi:MAG: restriction endonuclease subunit S, partial [Candidatus Nitrotoga sp.]